MNVIILGASGMVGQGVLHECLADPAVQKVVSLSRNSLADQHPKLGPVNTTADHLRSEQSR